MTLETAIDAVEWLHKNLEIKRKNNWTNHLQKHGERATINFFGGEPTLLWDKIIVPLTEYIENKYPNDFILGMTTNGTLLDENKIKFLKEHNFQLLLSIDGDKITQDYNRPCKNHQKSSFDLITKNVPLLLENFPYLTFRATIYQDTVDQMFNNYIYAQSLGFKRIFFAPNEREKWTKENIDKLSVEIQKIFYYTLLNFQAGYKPFIYFENMAKAFNLVKQMDIETIYPLKKKKTMNICNRCGLGTIYGSIGYDGTIYGCQEQDSKNNANNLFNLGNIYTGGINKKKHKKLLKKFFNKKSSFCEDKKLCATCIIKNQCNNLICPSTAMDIFNNFYQKTEIRCIYEQLLVQNACALMQILTNENNLLFKDYLYTLYKWKECD